MPDFLRPHGLYSPWNSPGQDAGVGSLSLLQGIFPAQGSNPGLLHCRRILYQLSHKGSPRILEWVAYPFFRESSKPRNQTGVSCIAGGFFTSWATEKPIHLTKFTWKLNRKSNTVFSLLLFYKKIHHASVLRLWEQASCPKTVALRPLNCEFLGKWINSLCLSCLILKY